MKVKYKGYTIFAHRDKCLGGWDQLYYYIERDSDGYMPVDNFTDGSDTVREIIKHLKARIDSELQEQDPWGEQAELLGEPVDYEDVHNSWWSR